MSVSPQSNKSLFTNERARTHIQTHTRAHTFEYKYLRGSTERRVNKYYICRCLSHNIIYSLVCARSFLLDRMYSNKINLAGAKAHHHPSTLPTAMSTINCHFIMSNIITPTPPRRILLPLDKVAIACDVRPARALNCLMAQHL